MNWLRVKSKKHKKVVAILLVVTLVVPYGVAVHKPQEAQADTASIVAAGIFGAATCSGIVDKAFGAVSGFLSDLFGSATEKQKVKVKDEDEASDRIKEQCLDVIESILVTIALRSIIGSITDWANKDFKGGRAGLTSAFERDIKKSFRVIESEATRRVLRDYELSEGLSLERVVCRSFGGDIRRLLQLNLELPDADARRNYNTRCTIDTILEEGGHTLEDFARDFRNGGWDAWIQLADSRNNRYGLYFTWQEELWRAQQEDYETRDRELSFGGGFFSAKQQGECLVTLAELEFDYEQAKNDPNISDEELQDIDASIAYARSTADGEACVQRGPDKITTPGKVVEEQLNKTLGLSHDRIVVADELNEMIGALLQAFVRNALRSIGGLFGASEPDPETGRSATDELRDANDDDINNNTNPDPDDGDGGGDGDDGDPANDIDPANFPANVGEILFNLSTEDWNALSADQQRQMVTRHLRDLERSLEKNLTPFCEEFGTCNLNTVDLDSYARHLYTQPVVEIENINPTDWRQVTEVVSRGIRWFLVRGGDWIGSGVNPISGNNPRDLLGACNGCIIVN